MADAAVKPSPTLLTDDEVDDLGQALIALELRFAEIRAALDERI
jgi:hypothetical protein